MILDDEQMANLDQLVARIVQPGKKPALGSLSDSEMLYVALASNSKKLLSDSGYTMVQAFERIGPEWRDHLLQKWQYTSKSVLRND